MPLKLADMSREYFKLRTQQAQQLVAAEAADGLRPMWDQDTAHHSQSVFCLQGGGVLFPESAWKTRKMPKDKTHKELCADNKVALLRALPTVVKSKRTQRHMLRVPAFTVILRQFPWGRLEKDGAFCFDIARGRFKVLGSKGLDIGAIAEGQSLISPPVFVAMAPPRLASEVEIKDWDGWYAWRRLSKESPAALLLNYPMSIYWLLVDTLRIGELALLLPYTDIKMVCFGQAVHTLVSRAKASHPKSIAVRASPTSPVYSYTAPEENGAGRIQIFLHGTADHWTPTDAHPALSAYGKPDAIVAPNAGLGSYPSWYPVILYAHQMDVPFGTTEYAEQSCEFQVDLFPQLLYSDAMDPGSVMGQCLVRLMQGLAGGQPRSVGNTQLS
ncbi:hypothetical protein B0H13DRAFT_2275615 [Mycena leptocephala]|nr:hypothetical protein B0H13DRAFT_2275615 [Mycena leptocephala]